MKTRIADPSRPYITILTPEPKFATQYRVTDFHVIEGAGNTCYLTVLNASGQPMAGEYVYQIFPRLDKPDDWAVLRTDANGKANWSIDSIQRGTTPGPYLTCVRLTKNDRPAQFADGWSEIVAGLGNHENRHDSFYITFQLQNTAEQVGAVEIKSVKLEPTTLGTNEPYGVLLKVTMEIYNGTATPMPTQDPAPGYRYVEGQTFQVPEVKGNYRVALDYEGRTGIDHPYRWGLGAPLAPGATVTVVGFVELHAVGTKKYWAGLVCEQDHWVQDHIGDIAVTVSEQPQPPEPPTDVEARIAALESRATDLEKNLEQAYTALAVLTAWRDDIERVSRR